ncbi:hypothetical protein L5515_009513 [Caenorhabditis briggsae]|uniref:C2H2-type domain-containing protein n=1 Tax=Caenorhabditis briggsae TaxID=6238 RepID=A0AAE9FA04_CAEBR|nr:hypothetical protein L5515_009513 [Caenorhabditis briggsae]
MNVIVVKPSSVYALDKLMKFLVENRLVFTVKCSEPIKETPTSSQASENIDFPVANRIREESNLDLQKITQSSEDIEVLAHTFPRKSNFGNRKFTSNNSDNLADNELRIPKEEPIAHSKKKPKNRTVSLNHPTCQLCHKKIPKANEYYRKKHAIFHLKLRTWKCTVCHKFFRMSSSGRAHFSSQHSGTFARLVQKISEKSKKRIDEMKSRCFPRDS